MAAKIQSFSDPLPSVAMASMQCHKPANETCQQKCNDKSLGHKVADTVHKAADVVHKAMKGNHHGHHASRVMACHGKTEKKMKEKKPEHKKKEKSVYKKKSKDCSRSCNDSDSSSSGSDSD